MTAATPPAPPRASPPDAGISTTRAARATDWARKNLFSTWLNSTLTVIFGGLLGWVIVRAIVFVFFNARWEIIRVNLTNLMLGLFPRPDVWRAWIALFLITAAIGVILGMSVRVAAATAQVVLPSSVTWMGMRTALVRLWPVALYLVVLAVLSFAWQTTLWLACLVVCAVLARAIGVRLEFASVRWILIFGAAGIVAPFVVLLAVDGPPITDWGGLLLTIFLAASGIIISFPIGVALALGRRSTLPAVRAGSVAYIEAVRGVPLITLLFMGSLMIQFFLPEQVATPNLVIRAVMALVIFTAAYEAEIVRGGLQAVPRGQTEAAQALGLRPFAQMRRIVLPQALRATIPAMVGQFISLLKDTSLVAIIGLNDLLAMSRIITSQGAFVGQGLLAETLVFASFTYWVMSYTMSRESQRLERRLGIGAR